MPAPSLTAGPDAAVSAMSPPAGSDPATVRDAGLPRRDSGRPPQAECPPTAAGDPSDAPAGDRRWSLATVALVTLLPALGTSIANVALPTLQVSFAVSGGDVQWVVIAYLLAITSLVVAAGRLGDMLGRRRLLLWGIGLFTVASAFGALAPSLGVLVAARAAQGVGAALMMALGVAMVGDVIPKGRTGSAMGLLGTVSAVGTALGPSLGGVLVAWFGWPSVFAALAAAGAATLALASLALPADPWRRVPRPSLDIAGIVLLALSLASYALSTTLDADLPTKAALVAGTALGLAAFVVVETRSAAPLVRLGLLREAELSSGLVALALVSAVVMATLVVGPFYLTGALGLGPMATGLAMTAGPVVAAATGVPAGRLVDRLGPRAVAFAGLAGVVVGSGLMTSLPGMLGVAGYLASLATITMGYGLFQAANNTAVMRAAAADRRGVTSALLALARNLGLVTGASALGAVFAAGSRTGGAAGADARLWMTFAAATALGGLAFAVAWWGYRRGAGAETVRVA